jgi:hypothetical protein
MVALRHLTDDERADLERELDDARRQRSRLRARLNADDLVVRSAQSRIWKLRQQIEACDRHIARFERDLGEAA